jgi:PAS domain S-box-containing protein
MHLTNPAAVRVLGAPDELYLLGMSLYDFCSGDYAQILRESFGEVLSGQESTVHTLTWFRRLDSQEFPADIDIARFQWGGQPAVQLMIHECSERVRSEETLRSKEEQVRQLQKMEAIGRLAGGVAHDFNNLLTAITGYGEMIHSLLDPTDPIRSDIEQILSASEKAASLTRQLLTFSRKQVLQLQVLNLNTVLLNTEKLLRRLIGEDIELVVKTDALLGNTRADPGQIEQVILNLAINARDAMPGGGKLTIETSNVDLDEEYLQTHVNLSPGSYVTLVVTDTGCGMTKEVQSKVFEPFYTTKSEGKGTGLGLSMVYGIVTQIGGSIWLYSEPGHGTSFKIYLPRVNVEPTEAPSKRQGMNQGSETILVVEDEEAVRMLVSAVLSRNGYNVLEAASPSEAAMISELYDGPIHLLLTDTVMPETSGPELARQQLEKRPEMKVMLMSGYAGSAIDHLHLPDSQTPFLEKPFTPETLTRKVRNLLDEN